MAFRFFFPLIPLIVLAISVVGVVVLTLGIRGRPIFSSPRCGKCGYDLRNVQFLGQQEVGNCPECGTSLSQSGGVSFGRWQRRPRQIVLGVVLLVLPWLLLIPTVYFINRARMVAGGGGPMGLGTQPTSAVLASLPANASQPWHWQELEKRLKAGSLTDAEVDAAFAALVKHLNAERAAGKDRQPLHWADDFINPAIAGKRVSQAQLDALCKAYYGDAPRVTMRDRARENEPILIEMGHEPWDLSNMKRCFWLSGVVADGATKLTPKLRYNEQATVTPDMLSGTDGELDLLFAHALAPGEHELTLTYEMGVVPQASSMRGTDGKPGTPEKWPTPIARWQATVKRKITIKPKDASILRLVTDPARDPFKGAPLTIEQALARPTSSRGVEIVLRWKAAGTPSLPVSYRVRAQVGEQVVDCGTFLTGSTGRMSFSSSSELRGRVKSLPADVTQINLSFEPEPKGAERYSEVEEMWGSPLEIKDVPLERFDLEKAPATAPKTTLRDDRFGAEQLVEQARS